MTFYIIERKKFGGFLKNSGAGFTANILDAGFFDKPIADDLAESQSVECHTIPAADFWDLIRHLLDMHRGYVSAAKSMLMQIDSGRKPSILREDPK